MKDFRKLNIWKNGMAIVKEVYLVSRQLPDEEKYGLRSQMTRAAVSIPSNIAEGCSRNSDVELVRFIEIALGSTFELETQLLLIQELFPDIVMGDIINDIHSQEKMMNAYRSSVKKNINGKY